MKNFNSWLQDRSRPEFRFKDDPPEDTIDRLCDIEKRLGIEIESKPEGKEAESDR